ncbi:daptide-type RiPP biosynthesis methyltransferase [Microbacterium sp. APC 3901]|uniref:daptide-type RiPP biosynthesis methyltransferase n=1 Tax=Microbacterium sp. APC 3901 TaxID=3035192 RepID=UPI0025B5F9EB|nr:daptide-type RiPP biosynthesis methyltransferase [Microbacterium sp. APC 3901]MDN3442903.1 class I SAM-dependent methyltransferase [Microbacterium sp. APC 3901]
MSSSLTEAVVARLCTVGAVPKEQDLYSGAGTDFYDRLVGPDRAEIREMLALARDTEGPILDLAAGTGRLTVPLVRSGKRVTAIDLSDDMLARLRRALPEHAMLECVVADMRDFSLPQQFGLVIIGATSITLLDRVARSLLYANVRRHLAPHGVFAFTLAGDASAQTFSVSTDREIEVPGPDGAETYLFSQQVEEDGAARVVNWVRAADLTEGGEVTVLTSRLRVLDRAELSRELVEAGFSVPAISPVRTLGGEDIVLLTTTCAGHSEERDADASR